MTLVAKGLSSQSVPADGGNLDTIAGVSAPLPVQIVNLTEAVTGTLTIPDQPNHAFLQLNTNGHNISGNGSSPIIYDGTGTLRVTGDGIISAGALSGDTPQPTTFTGTRASGIGTFTDNGIQVIVDTGHTYRAREQVVLAPASNGGSISNPGTATFNIRDGVSQLSFTGGTGSTEVGAYRVFNTTGGAAGARIGGGSAVRYPGGYASFDEGALAAPTLSATNIPNPVSIGAGSVVGGVTTGGTQLNTFAGGIQENTNNAIRMAVVYQRGRNAAYQGQSSGSFQQRLFFLNSGASGIRAILFGPEVTYTGRRIRLTNTRSVAVTVSGTFSGLIQPGQTVEVRRNSEVESWNYSAILPALNSVGEPLGPVDAFGGSGVVNNDDGEPTSGIDLTGFTGIYSRTQ